MENSFVKELYKLAPNYRVEVVVGHGVTTIAVASLKTPKVVKKAVLHTHELPLVDKRDAYLTGTLSALVSRVKEDES